ncbi:cell surface protein, putative [Trichomonas vaginalis G3]|uniref:Cell surface protein, putative n=1 Tax=Trichomonas vaginalis (strain ATCC PRA-98 / G3) TaxID=412133 RepID=A2EDK3_TRIV3|nr:ribonuclease inhibitor domain-containing protein [Trichomonas vaginalis G3]EAY09268.1 cell surface protein, putative [Trichomonas vaginalis G3]KAI5484054.1 ribonuclease inhibitor domain-containing protein [Trichomonas vaginalis G3]|eukprot:XP_001321491.1 cell surface protein [Trichomonas vaginalis G3]
MITSEIKLNAQIQINNGKMIFNSIDDFSDARIIEQIKTNNIDTINIENNINEIKYFLGIEFIKNVNINSDQTVTLSDSLFYGSRNIETIICTNNIVVGPKCFEQSTIRNIDFTKITEIGEDAFKNCFNIKSANLKSLISIGNSAFASSGLESVIIPSTISKIPDHCFYQCPNLTNVEFKGPVDIYQYAFADCFQLSNVVPGFEQISHIKHYGFRGCSVHKLKSNDCELGGGVFQNSHVESIDATNLKIASKDFRGCRNLVYVNITGTLEIIDGPPPEVPYYYEM